jgi:hypothetical protein
MLGWRNRKRRKLLAIFLPMLLLASLAMGISACGGGGGGGGASTTTNNSNTPKGNYSITVTATSGSLSHSATHSYTVN